MIRLEIHGMERIVGKLDSGLWAAPMHRFLQRSTATIEREAKLLAPADTGHLRRTIKTQVDQSMPPMWGKAGVFAGAGSDFVQARSMEFGTGLLAEGPNATHRRHWPPAAALETWARRHNVQPQDGLTPGGVIARAIGRRGGLRPRRFLRTGFRNSVPQIRVYLRQMAGEIGREWERRT